MKNKMVFAFIVLFLTALMVPSFAQGGSAGMGKSSRKVLARSEMINGRIVAIDSVKHEIMIKQRATGADKTIKVDPKEIALLKVGEMVRIKVKPGSDVAQSVRLVVAKKK